jgi:hypothetical protein
MERVHCVYDPKLSLLKIMSLIWIPRRKKLRKEGWWLKNKLPP